MPPIQGYLAATYEDMTGLFGEPEKLPKSAESSVQWRLDGGTVLRDLRLDGVPAERQSCWHIAGWSKAAVDQVIGLLARAGRLGVVALPRSLANREAVSVAPVAMEPEVHLRRIDENTVELSDQARLVNEIHNLLLDQGHSQGDALILLRGSRVPEGLRSETPLLDAVLTPELADWLAE